MGFALLIGAVVAVIWLVRRRSAKKPTPPPSSARPSPVEPSIRRVESDRRRRVHATREWSPSEAREDYGYKREIPFAEAHQLGPLFHYGGAGGRGRDRHEHHGPYAVIDLETTGLSPKSGDRVIEVAVARVDAKGRIEDEFATLIHPDGADTGPVFIHGISNDAVRDAPRFADIAGELLARLDGAVVVAHNATFEEHFLRAEFARAGITLSQPLPALCTLWLAQRTVSTPNHRLGTLCRHHGIPLVDKHAALGDVRATSALLPRLLDSVGQPLVYGATPASGLAPGYVAGSVIPRTRAVQLRKGTEGWMTSLMARLPMTAAEATGPQAAMYLDELAEVLEDGRIIGDQAKKLAKIAGAAGMGGAQVRALNHQFLDLMLQAALEDDALTGAEIRDLKRAATALGEPNRFDHLTPTFPAAPSRSSARVVTEPANAARTVMTNEGLRANRTQRAKLAVQQQQRGDSREQIAATLGVSVATVKTLLRDGRFYLDPSTDPVRCDLARAAAQSRQSGQAQADFRSDQALSAAKTQEAWRDAAFLLAHEDPLHQ